jgi:hypothetical protein
MSVAAIAQGFNLQPKDIRNALKTGDAIPKGVVSILHLKTTPRSADSNESPRTPRMIKPYIGQSH